MMNTVSRRRRVRAVRSGVGGMRMMLEVMEPRTMFSGTVAMMPAQAVADANNAFAFSLFTQLQKMSTDGNTFFSPYSISTALETALQGAKGATAAQMIQVLHLPSASIAQAGIQALYQLFQMSPGSGGPTLSTANQLWVNQNLSLIQSYLNDTQNLFGAGAQAVDFSDPVAAASRINAWVSDQTHGKIQNLVPPSAINDLTKLIITNAIYFQGDWASAFNAISNRDAIFQNTATTSSTVRMMFQEGGFDYYAQGGANGFQAVDIPYQGDDLDMVVILPTSGDIAGFDATLTAALFTKITSNFSEDLVALSLPKFTLDETYDLGQSLENMGIEDAFKAGVANFDGIAKTESPRETGLYISDVIHKSHIEIGEKGTEAAAATAIVIGAQISAISVNPTPPPVPKVVDADHPFLFAIREKSTNTILFMGQVSDPGYVADLPSTLPPGWFGIGPIEPVQLPPAPSPTPTPTPSPPPTPTPTPTPTPAPVRPILVRDVPHVVLPAHGVQLISVVTHARAALPVIHFVAMSAPWASTLSVQSSLRRLPLDAYESPAISGSENGLLLVDGNGVLKSDPLIS